MRSVCTTNMRLALVHNENEDNNIDRSSSITTDRTDDAGDDNANSQSEYINRGSLIRSG